MTGEIPISEAKELKKEMENKIYGLIRGFEEKTSCHVTHIELTQTIVIGVENPRTGSLSSRVRL